MLLLEEEEGEDATAGGVRAAPPRSCRATGRLTAERATISNLSGCSSAMSKVCVPMDPVEPRREIFLTLPLPSRVTSEGTSARPGQQAP